MNVHDIVKEWLERYEYEGLFCDECSCELSDLFPCGDNDVSGCEPGYKIPCVGEDCEAIGRDHFHIGIDNWENTRK